MKNTTNRELPADLSWLATDDQPGRRIAYSFRCPNGFAVWKHHRDLPDVQRYNEELKNYLMLGRDAQRTTKLGARAVLTAKNNMVRALLRYYGLKRRGGPAELRERLREADNIIRRLRGAPSTLGGAAEEYARRWGL